MKKLIAILLIIISIFAFWQVYEHRPKETDICWKTKEVFYNQSVDNYLVMNFYDISSIGLPKELIMGYKTYVFEGENKIIKDMEKDKIYIIEWCNISNKSLIRGIER